MTSDAVYFPDSQARLDNLPSQGDDQTSSANFDEVTDENLMEGVGGGSKEALGLLFRKHRRPVLNIAKRILRDPSEAEDLCQEVFLLLFEKAKLFDPSKGSASSWIIQIAYHRAMNRRQYLAFRQHYQAHELNEEQVASQHDSLMIDALSARALLERLQGDLTEDQRRTLELHFAEGYSLREVAEKTNQTLGNTRNHFYRGLERLRSLVFLKRAPK
jgi:RNA polymerase sigma-70 factor (ECF subfamily)